MSEPSPQESATGGTSAAEGTGRDRIATRAYELYLARGSRDGGALDDWLTAERELRSTDEDDGRGSR